MCSKLRIAFLATGSSLQVIDISDPTQPTIIGSVNPPGSASGVAVDGGLAFVVGGGSLSIIDVSDPTV